MLPHIQQQRVNSLPVLFLDSSASLRSNYEFLTPSFTIPTSAYEHLSSKTDVHNMLTDYFEKIHIWMPIVSRRGLSDQMENELGDDLCSTPSSKILLLNCMKLMLWAPSDDEKMGVEPVPQTPAYIEAKALWLEAEMAGVLSLTVLQAGVLLAYYETGHAIYPAAVISVGACARYGTALGIDRLRSESGQDWVEVEEKKRVWWAIVILDR